MDRLTIGIVVDDLPLKLAGGGHTYTAKLVNAIDEFKFDENIEVLFVGRKDIDKDVKFNKQFLSLDHASVISKNSHAVRGVYFYNALKTIFPLNVVRSYVNKKVNAIVGRERTACLKEKAVDLLYYIQPITTPFYDYDFIVTNWDMGYKSIFLFPEFVSDQKFETREKYFRNVLPRAFSIIAESEAGKGEIVFYERINEDKIFVLPMFAGTVTNILIDSEAEIEILEENGLMGKRFIFYPAQFWAHKNHYNLLKAFKIVLAIYPDLFLVFCGSDKGNLGYIIDKVKEYDLQERVIFLGFVSDEVLNVLYTRSEGLVFPSLLGPTNMPLVEAMELSCKIACSNLKGHVEQAGDYAIFFDPLNSADIAKAIVEMVKSQKTELRYHATRHKTMETLNSIFQQIYNIRRIYH